MSIISANTLFHFTHTLDTLLIILETGFRPSYCKEFGEVTSGATNESYIPMVCFCDLPLSSIEKHSTGYKWIHKGEEHNFSGYGRYAIGLSKEWGETAMLNPVTYITNNSYYLRFAIWLNKLSNELSNTTELWAPIYNLNPADFPNPSAIHQLQLAVAPLGLRSRYMSEVAHALFSYIKPQKNLQTGQRYYDERVAICSNI